MSLKLIYSEPQVQLNLSIAEFTALVLMLRTVGGDREHSPRKYIDSIAAKVYASHIANAINMDLFNPRESQTVYFAEGMDLFDHAVGVTKEVLGILWTEEPNSPTITPKI